MAARERDERHLRDAWDALDAFFGDDPYYMTRHHIDSYDRFIGGGIANTLRNMKPITLLQEHPPGSGKKVEVKIFVGPNEVKVDMPNVADAGAGASARPLFPNEARLRDLTYAVNVYADVRVEYRDMSVGVGGGAGASAGELIAAIPFERPVCLGQIPLMLHSRHCLLHGLSREALRAVGECPNDRGGYFVVDGKEKVIVARESLVKNRVYVRKGESSKPDVAFVAYVRCDSPDDSFPRTTTFYVRSPTAPSRPNTISVIVAHLGNVRSNTGPANTFSGEVPLFVLFRALGVESDKAILSLVVYDVDAPEEADVIEFLRACAIHAAKLGATDQRTAQALMAPLVRETDSLKQVLTDDLFPNVGKDFRVKALFLGHAVRTVVRAALGKAPLSNRDDYVNKRLDLSGFLLEDLFRDVFLRVRRQSVNRLAGEWQSGAWNTSGDVTKLVNVTNVGSILEGGMLTERIRRSMKGDWGPDEEPDPESDGGGGDGTDGMVQDLSRVSYSSYVSHVRRLNNPVDRTVKMAAPHELRASHWGAICPVESPDGPSVGLLNHLATTCTISMGVGDADGAKARAAIESGGDALSTPLIDLARRPPERALPALRGACKVLVNDTWNYVTYDPPALVKHLRAMRRRGELHAETSIAWSIHVGELHVHTDRGRFLRPLCVVDAASATLPLEAVVAAARKKGTPLSWRRDLLASSPSPSVPPALELVDVEELRTLLVAMRPSDLGPQTQTTNNSGSKQRGLPPTHCELHAGAAMLSISSNTFPMMHHNMASRNVLGMAQFKQAIGTYSTAFRTRFDTTGYVLHHPQRPLVGTGFADALCAGQWAQGENIIVAVCTYSGYNMEDSVLLNRDSVGRGRFHMTHYEAHRYEESAGDGSDRPVVAFANPHALEAAGQAEVEGGRTSASYGALGPDGFPTLDAEIREGDVVLGRVEIGGKPPMTPSSGEGGRLTQKVTDRSVVATRKTSGVVDRVAVYPSPLGGQARCCKVRMRQHRAPTLGDKLASRFAQKGCIGLLMPATDMPFSATTGMVPDIVFNPHGFPSRCTVSHMIELALAKAAAYAGARYNVNSVEEPRGDPIAEAASVLGRLGLHKTGDEVLHNGRTGEMMHVDVYVGVNHYGRLKHMVADKYQHRLRGPVGAITRQPVKQPGAGSGGLRIGEMEQNVLLAHGISGFLKESFADRSDRHRVVVDADEGEHVVISRLATTRAAATTDGANGTNNSSSSMLKEDVVRALPGSGVMGGPPRFATVEMPYAFKLLQQELASMSVGTLLRTEGDGGEHWFDAEADVEAGDDDDDEDGEVAFSDDGGDGRKAKRADENDEDFGDATFADAAGADGEGDD
jgi:DNA-directed RNA polymerase II subunit RPB2